MPKRWDYIVIGAGSAGCVLAARLSEDPDVSVLLVEAGGSDRTILVQMPAAVGMAILSPRFNWRLHSQPEPGLNGRRIYTPRGRGLGGSSSINGMIYIRGHPSDYDRWAFDEGCDGWSFPQVLPYFRRSEDHAAGDDAWHGTGGPLHVKTGSRHQSNPLYDAFIHSGVAAGYPATADVNGPQQEGFGRFDMKVRHGRRWSTANAYLRPAQGSANLTVMTHAHAAEIIVENGRARGLAVVRRKGRTEKLEAEREVLLCAGAIGSPQLLMLSGIGPADDLARVGITVKADLPGVGGNLQDHLEVHVQQACTQPITLFRELALHRKALTGLRWLLTRDGMGATNHYEAGAFVRGRADVAHPDQQIHFAPIAYGENAAERRVTEHGYRVHIGPLRPRARGRLWLTSRDPKAPPAFRFNYLDNGRDIEDFRTSIRIAREIFAQAPLSPFRGRELSPGADITSITEMDAWVRAHAESGYHPAGTCRMGRDQDAVVDPQCRVLGIEGLRVVDASIMPSIVSGNLNAPVIMMAEKASDMIAGKPPLPASDPRIQTSEDQPS
jgi:choline dehydrogenase